MKCVGSKYQKEFMADLKKVYKAPTKDAAQIALNELEEKYPIVINSWKNNKNLFQIGLKLSLNLV